MKIYLTLLLNLVAFAFGEDIKEEEDVLVLTEAVFDQAITDNEHILVEFCKLLYTLWLFCEVTLHNNKIRFLICEFIFRFRCPMVWTLQSSGPRICESCWKT